MTRLPKIITVLAILAMCSSAWSDDLHVPADYNTIQAAIDAAVDGDVVIVADGNYTGPGNKNLDFAGRAITVRSLNGPESTTIDCENAGRGFYFHSAEDSNSILIGFTIKNGYVTASHVRPNGGGILCDGSSPIIDNCILKANKTDGGAGGGIACISGSNATVLNCIFLQNVAKEGSDGDGAGMLISWSNVLVKNCLFFDNTGGYMGGGGGIRNYKASATIINCTFVNNYAGYCGGVVSAPNCHTTLINCILWGNDGWWTKELGGDDNSHTTVINCDIRGGISGTRHTDGSSITDGGGNINADPLFATGLLGDYYLSQIAAGQASDSSCVDAGSDLASALGLDIYTTRTDQIPDTNVVDIGYHYLPPNTNPVACVVDGDRVVQGDSNCEARVVLDGSCSSDEDSTVGTNDDINDFDWFEVIDACDPNSDIYIGSGEVIECNLGLGAHLIILEVTDKAGAFDSNEVVITVVDDTPPEFSLTVEPNVLWPPNGKMVEVRPEWQATDNCDEEVEVSLVDISMSPAGDINDYVHIGDDGSIYLRARKSKSVNGRTYTLTYEAVDDSGNVTEASATVTVRRRGGPRKLDRGLVRRLRRQVYRRVVPQR